MSKLAVQRTQIYQSQFDSTYHYSWLCAVVFFEWVCEYSMVLVCSCSLSSAFSEKNSRKNGQRSWNECIFLYVQCVQCVQCPCVQCTKHIDAQHMLATPIDVHNTALFLLLQQYVCNLSAILRRYSLVRSFFSLFYSNCSFDLKTVKKRNHQHMKHTNKNNKKRNTKESKLPLKLSFFVNIVA